MLNQYASEFGKLSSGHSTGKGKLLLVAQSVKHLPATEETRVWFLVWKIPWRRKWQATPVFLPGKSHGQRSLVGYSPWGPRVEHDLATKPPKNVQITAQLYSSHTPAKQYSKFSKPDFNSMWTENFQMFKLNLEKAEELEIKLPTSESKRISGKHLLLLHWLH